MQEYKDWDGNLLPDSAPTIQHVHKGFVIRVSEQADSVGHGKTQREYVIEEIYQRTVMARDKKTGFRRSFSYGDLLTLGIEHQGAEMESMRKTYGEDQKRENLSKKLSLFNPEYNPDNYKKRRKEK